MTINEKKRFRSIVAREIRRRNHDLAGSIITIVWGRDFAGIAHDRQGVVVVQKQYRMETYSFSVCNSNLHMNGKTYWLPALENPPR